MTRSTSVTGDPRRPAAARRPRNAAATRGLLLDAALRRFTVDGYATTTVRQIAEDAGVNVALISRYFTSKEGLFEACLEAAGAALRSAAGAVTERAGGTDGPERNAAPQPSARQKVAEAISRQAVGVGSGEGAPHALLLLLRSSGDPAAERLRLAMLRSFAEKLAAAAGWSPDADDDDLLLRAQVVLATAVGIAVLRASGGLEPLASTAHEHLVGPVHDMVEAVLR